MRYASPRTIAAHGSRVVRATAAIYTRLIENGLVSANAVDTDAHQTASGAMDHARDSKTPDSACLTAWHGGVTFALYPPTPFGLDLGAEDYHLLLAYDAGAIDLRVKGGPTLRRSLRPDELVVSAAGSSFAARYVAPLEFLVVTIPADRGRTVAQQSGLGPGWALADTPGWRDPSVAVLGPEMRRVRIAEGLPQAAYLAALADVLLARLMLSLAQRPPHLAAHALAPVVLARVVEHIEAHLDRSLSVADLARVASRSTGHFARAFARTTGDPPLRLLMKRRVCRARDLLSGTTLPIAEIAMRTGFSSQAHLSTVFAKQVGLSPAKYRNSFQREEAFGHDATANLE